MPSSSTTLWGCFPLFLCCFPPPLPTRDLLFIQGQAQISSSPMCLLAPPSRVSPSVLVFHHMGYSRFYGFADWIIKIFTCLSSLLLSELLQGVSCVCSFQQDLLSTCSVSVAVWELKSLSITSACPQVVHSDVGKQLRKVINFETVGSCFY